VPSVPSIAGFGELVNSVTVIMYSVYKITMVLCDNEAKTFK